MKNEINISAGHQDEFIGKFEINNEIYQVNTENLTRICKVVTRIYSKGEILSTATSDYAHMAKFPKLKENVETMMERQHKSAIESFIRKHSESEKTRAQYAEEIREGMKGGDRRLALDIARRALVSFPSDPFFLSYCGYLVAVVERKPKEGAKMCEGAINVLRRSGSADSVFFMPLFYLHLGRVYLKGNNKKAALKAFQHGLKYDRSDQGLLSEIKGLGVRKRPVIPFLKRGHPVNRYLGKIRHKLQTGS